MGCWTALNLGDMWKVVRLWIHKASENFGRTISQRRKGLCGEWNRHSTTTNNHVNEQNSTFCCTTLRSAQALLLVAMSNKKKEQEKAALQRLLAEKKGGKKQIDQLFEEDEGEGMTDDQYEKDIAKNWIEGDGTIRVDRSCAYC